MGSAAASQMLNTGAPTPPAAPRALVIQPVTEAQRTILRGNTHPLVRRAVDQGLAPSSLLMQRMILVLQRSAEQESALRTLLDAQQTKGSPNYHQWQTPQQFGRQFGPTDSDIAAAEAWLESHGFQVAGVSNGRIAIEFSGTAGQVQEAFHTSIHSYGIKGEQHWANASDPSIPSALAPLVTGVLTLHNFPRHRQSTLLKAPAIDLPGQDQPSPLFTYTSGKSQLYGVGPTDFATIYNVLPLWKAGIDGTGQTIAIVGETNIHLSDIATFRSIFGLPANAPHVILNGPDPGISDADEPEAVLDVSWSGAVAKNATIDLVASASTDSSLGVDLSALYIVDNNLAPVMSESYGECEAQLGTAGNAFYNALWQQAAAQGITVLVAAGDAGSAGCDNMNTEAEASDGLAVSGFASTPYDIAVGGTDFDQTAATAPNYWSATNNPNTGASALGYIPETTWNQTCAGLGLNQSVSQCAVSGDNVNIVAGSGGRSQCWDVDQGTGACLSGYVKPVWQTGAGVPQDGMRDLPDVSLFASAGFNDSFYIVCEADLTPFGIQTGANFPCNLTDDSFSGVGGTSASAPTFAGMMALVNQKTDSRQGNANYVLYNLAAQTGASCNSSMAPATGGSCIFYDITKGNISVPCTGTLDCGLGNSNNYGIMIDPSNPSVPAYATTAGYDLATGLGSVNAANLVSAWNSAVLSPSKTSLTSLNPVNIIHGQPVEVNVTVAAKSGSGMPTGAVALMASPAGSSVGVTNFSLVNGAASGTTTLLPGGTYEVTAHYPGDGTFAASDSSPMQMTVGEETSQTSLSLESYDPLTATFTATNTVPYGSIFFLRGDVRGAAGVACGANPQLSRVACPTGTIGFTMGGKPLDGGTFALNSQGYTEDQAVYLDTTSAGSYVFQGLYSGDASYNGSSAATLNAVVTKAPTAIAYLYVNNLAFDNSAPGTYEAWSGQTFTIFAPVTTASALPPPTGTIAVLANGTLAPGVMSYNSFSGAPYPYAYFDGTLAVTINTPGTYIYTASYSGDANYLASQSTSNVTVTVVDTTFNITPPISNVTITTPGQTGTTSVTLAGVDSFAGMISITCTLPAAMTESTCPATSATLGNTQTATAQLTITTTAAHQLTLGRASGKRPYALAALACVFLWFLPVGWRRKTPLAMLCLVSVVAFGGCGGGTRESTAPKTDPGTPAGTYTVNLTATSMNITRTGTFTVTVQ